MQCAVLTAVGTVGGIEADGRMVAPVGLGGVEDGEKI